MRLLNATTLNLDEFFDEVPPYAILSHTWEAEEVGFQDLADPDKKTLQGFAKIRGCCAQALRDGHD